MTYDQQRRKFADFGFIINDQYGRHGVYSHYKKRDHERFS